MNDLNIILPVYNEEKTITKVLIEWNKVLNKNKIKYNFIICEDGSTDGTKALLKQIKTNYPLIINSKNNRRGYGAAVIDGIKIASSNYILCIDSDGQCDPNDFSKFWKEKNNADILIGWRTKRQDNAQRILFSKLFKITFNLLFQSKINDPSAPFVLFQKKTIVDLIVYLKYLNEGFWWGFIGTCQKKSLTILEIPINHLPRNDGTTQVYKTSKIPLIAISNLIGLIKLWIKK